MDSKYQHQQYEAQINQLWDEAKVASPGPKKNIDTPSFSIVLPPPNANDPLHVGHAMYTVEDILIRFHRMWGDDTLWLPGADHAGIETQFVYEKKLRKAGTSRFQLDRETLYSQIWDYVQENAGVAKHQLQRLGFSLDWSRFKFTLDKDIVTTVLQTFQELVSRGLVYRDLKLVNYCPKCGTAFSDLEVKHTTQKTPLYYLKYGPFILATTRPETKFGDTAVAVHPDDQRYQQWIGQEIEVEGLNGKFKLKVIADEYVDPEFGTGVVKITPYHDHNDYEVWQRHLDELPEPQQVIDFNGKLTKIAGQFEGMPINTAREEIIKQMTERGLVDHIDHDYQTQLNVCYRCGRTLEPLPLPQFFIRVKPLTEPIIEKLDQGEVRVHGAGYDKILRHWLTNLHDWNISRQIVWGIRMPIWYQAEQNPQIQISFLNGAGEKIVGKLGDLMAQYPLAEIKAGLQSLDAPVNAKYEVIIDQEGRQLDDYIQETDTFDTWFSSSQWPFATLMNAQPGDFERFYPTTCMETAYDILAFWVMRMLMMGYFKTGKLPFTEIYLHGLIRDSKGQKMSKSKGNVINPLEVADKYGADALRFALVVRSTAGQDKSIGDGDFKAARNLTNKIWNAARFVIMLNQEAKPADASDHQAEQQFDHELQQVIGQVTQALKDYKVGLAADLLYDSFWHYFCDQAIEQGKQGKIGADQLRAGLEVYLKLWHPFVPFVTEQIWQELGEHQHEQILAKAAWPATVARPA